MLEINHASPLATLAADAVTTDVGDVDGTVDGEADIEGDGKGDGEADGKVDGAVVGGATVCVL